MCPECKPGGHLTAISIQLPKPSWAFSQMLHNPSPGSYPHPRPLLKVPPAQTLLEASLMLLSLTPHPHPPFSFRPKQCYPAYRDEVSPSSGANLQCDFGQRRSFNNFSSFLSSNVWFIFYESKTALKSSHKTLLWSKNVYLKLTFNFKSLTPNSKQGGITEQDLPSHLKQLKRKN